MTANTLTDIVNEGLPMPGLLYQRRHLLATSACLAVALVLPAWLAPVQAADNKAVVAPIERLNNGLLEIMRAGTNTPFQQRFNMLAPIVDESFDLDTILQESIGFTWASMSPADQEMLRQAFRRYTVASYVNSFDGYNGQRFEVDPNTRPVGSNEQVVQTRIIPRSGSGHEINYVMREVGTGWRAVDVLADGSISRVAVQRSDFRRLLTRGGPQALAESLRTKSASLSEGSS